VKLTKDDMELFGEDQKSKLNKNNVEKIMDIGDELIMTNRYY